MNGNRKHRGLILSPRIIAAHQAATLLEQQAWHMTIEHDEARAREFIENERPSLFVVDIDCPEISGRRLLTELSHGYPSARLFALCAGGNSQGMRIARALGVTDYFFLNPHGRSLDSFRGLARPCRIPQPHASRSTPTNQRPDRRHGAMA